MMHGLTIAPATTTTDDAFIVEMARHASVIEDWPLPEPDSEDTQSVLPAHGDLTLIAKDHTGFPVGAIWIYHNKPPLMVDTDGIARPEIVMAVIPEKRGQGIGGALLDDLINRSIGMHQALSLNVHQRNPASRLYERKGFQTHGQGRGALGISMKRELN